MIKLISMTARRICLFTGGKYTESPGVAGLADLASFFPNRGVLLGGMFLAPTGKIYKSLNSIGFWVKAANDARLWYIFGQLSCINSVYVKEIHHLLQRTIGGSQRVQSGFDI
jgi:hypothetical protein